MADRVKQWFRGATLAVGALTAAAAVAAPTEPAGGPVTESHFHGFAPRVALDVGREAHSVIADDVNGDGKLDLIVAVALANSVAVFAGHGDGTFEPPVYWPTGA